MLAEIGVNSLSIFPEIGLLIFLVVFAAVTVRALRRPKSEMHTCANLPLNETPPTADDTKQAPGEAR